MPEVPLHDLYAYPTDKVVFPQGVNGDGVGAFLANVGELVARTVGKLRGRGNLATKPSNQVPPQC